MSAGFKAIDFSCISSYKDKNIIPLILVNNKSFYRINNWKDCLKIFYFNFYQDDTTKLSISQLITTHTELFSQNDNTFYESAKFAPNTYLKLDTSYNDLLTFNLLYNSIRDTNRVSLFVYCTTDKKESIDEDIEKDIVSSMEDLTKTERIREKTTRNVIARINSQVYSLSEKLFAKIERMFDRSKFLGDMYLDDTEEALLNDYTKNELIKINRMNGNYTPKYREAFCTGICRIAQKEYKQKTLWPVFDSFSGCELTNSNRTDIYEIVKDTLAKHEKQYVEGNMVDSFALQSLVTDYCCSQFFDYLFDFWKIDLKRDIDALSERFDDLIEELQQNNKHPNIMLHTTLALQCYPQAFKIKTRNLIKTINNCFESNEQNNAVTNNRLKRLLYQWAKDPAGKLQKEYEYFNTGKHSRSEKSIKAPVLSKDKNNGGFFIMLPSEHLENYTSGDIAYWTIVSDNYKEVFEIKRLLYGSSGIYTDESAMQVPVDIIFKKMTFILSINDKRRRTFSIAASSFRFFDANNESIDYTKVIVNKGRYDLATLGKLSFSGTARPIDNPYQISNNVYEQHAVFKNDDIIVLDDGYTFKVGSKLSSGFVYGTKVSDAYAQNDDSSYDIYSSLPKIIISESSVSVEGATIIVNDLSSDTVSKVFKLEESNYKHIKYDEKQTNITGCMISLEAFISKRGLYQIIIKSIQSHHSTEKQFSLCYMPGFNYRFVPTSEHNIVPYLFSPKGNDDVSSSERRIEIEANCGISLKKVETWNVSDSQLTYSFDESDRDNPYIENEKLKLPFVLNEKEISIFFKIPAFYWKYKKEDRWHFERPASVGIKAIPDYLYIKGPASLGISTSTKLFVQEEAYRDDVDTNTLFAKKQSDQNDDCYSINIGSLRNWLNKERETRTIYFEFYKENGENGIVPITYQFFDVICKSTVLSWSISGDFNNGILKGNFVISRDGDYVVDILFNNKIVAEDISLDKGKFEESLPLQTGTYTVRVYEVDSDESGFSASERTSIGDFSSLLIDVNAIPVNQAFKIITATNLSPDIDGFQLRNNKALFFNIKEKIKYSDIEDNICDKWTDDTVTYTKCCCYKGTLWLYNAYTKNKSYLCEALVIFAHNENPNKVIIWQHDLNDDEYYSLIYNKLSRLITTNDSQTNTCNNTEIGQAISIDDDRYEFQIEFVEEQFK